jgi:hypothetical protein
MAGIYFLQKCICVTAPLIRRPRPLSSSMGDNLGHYGFVVCRAGGRAPLPLSMQPLLNFHSGQIEKNDRRSSRMGQVGSGGLLLLLPRVTLHFVPFHFVPVSLSPGHFVPGQFVPWSLCSLVILSPGHFVPGHFVPWSFCPPVTLSPVTLSPIFNFWNDMICRSIYFKAISERLKLV